jgi:hypothetical protein
MSKPFETWKVLPHGKLTEIDENVLTVVGQIHMPLGEFPRRMTVVRLHDGRLVIYSAIALDDDEMRALERYGHPAFLVVPGDHHRLDAKIWKQRYPRMQVAAPAGALEMGQQVVQVDTVAPRFDDLDVQWITVPGTREHEAALLVRGPAGKTLVLNDIVANIRHEHGFSGWLMRRMGFAADEPTIPGVRKLAMIKDAQALREQLFDWSEIADLRRILVSHGETIVDDPRGVLRGLAQSLH